jgi:hypothetical protein
MKLDTKKLGPFKIPEQVGQSSLAFKLELPPQMCIYPVFHMLLLKPYQQSTTPGWANPPPPLPEEIDGKPEFEVKEILDSKVTHNRLFYLVN